VKSEEKRRRRGKKTSVVGEEVRRANDASPETDGWVDGNT